MNIGIYTYSLTVLIFAAIPVAIEWIVCYDYLKKYIIIIAIISALFLVFGMIGNNAAVTARIWLFPDQYNLGLTFGDLLETNIYSVLVGAAVSGAALIWTDREEKGEPLLKNPFKK